MNAVHIMVAMKPVQKNYTDNAQRHGVSGLNIDATRIQTDDKLGGGAENPEADAVASHAGYRRPWMDDEEARKAHSERVRENVEKAQEQGRWPANVIHDGSEEIVGSFPKTGGGGKPKTPVRQDGDIYGKIEKNVEYTPYSDTMAGGGSSSRFFKECKDES